MDTNSNSKNDTGILLIGHGSRLPYNKEVISAIAEKYAQWSGCGGLSGAGCV